MSSSNSKLLIFSKKFYFFKKIYLFYNVYIRNFKFYFSGRSQLGEEKKLLTYFKKNYKGRYVDLGCFHPTRHNNTFEFYKKGWRGINIDLNPLTIDLFNFARPKDVNVCAAISNNVKIKKLFYLGDLSSQNTLEKKHTKWLMSHFSYNKKEISIKKIKTQKIGDILEKNKFYNIDFMNIDVEGHEIKILKTLNLKKFKIKYFCIEILTYDNFSRVNKKKIISFFKKNKYQLKYISQVNYIFKKNKQ
jgi:FkbM family methyltransferase|tara:strand:- start:16 stop:753 length:738 start_codon:yes stop_codon:yes gene_type:complete